MERHGPQARWLIDEIGTLDETSYRAGLGTWPRSFTLTAWMYPVRSAGRQVVIRLNAPDVPGWSMVLDGGRLSAEFGTAETVAARVDGPRVDMVQWTFTALTMDAAAGTMQLTVGAVHAEAQVDTAAVSPNLLIVGGYTDAAGGHYDHTFGRGGTGWVDDVCMYDRVMDAGELAALAVVGGSAPTARIEFRPDGDAPCDVHFEAAGAVAARGVMWDFGDGTSAVGRKVAHRYAYAGSYDVRATVIGTGHQQAVAHATVTLAGAADPLTRVPVFINGTEGHACYRIPSIVRAANGDLLAFAEGRRDSCSDSTPVIRIVGKRSTDNGATWGPLQIVARHTFDGGEHALMNASPVVDMAGGTGRVILLYNLMTANEWALARGEGRNHTYCIVSDDHGVTWSLPRDISDQIGRPEWRIQRPTLGHAVQRADGRILHASTITVGDSSVFDSQNVLVWSDDLGETWRHADPCPTIGLNEATAAVLDGGTVLINCRAYLNGQPVGLRALTRAMFESDDSVQYGETVYHPLLIDSAVQASILKVGSYLLFSNPAHPKARRRLAVHVSADGGHVWLLGRVIDAGPAAYSDLVQQADDKVGVLYERGNQGGIVYVNFDLDWLVRDPSRFDSRGTP
ncbi:MAG: exo-alpha-sialidase [Chloroflexi bacterium]|nr:exo-alpha-sialidase [Chloroflexota bacterium]